MYNSFHKIEPLIWELCGKKTDGFYVDIGAFDGVDGSNTLYFEKIGWKGICVEPHPVFFKQLVENRKCQLESCAIWKADEEVDFLAITGYSSMLSGIPDTYDPRHRSRISGEIRSFGGEEQLIKVPGKKFSTICKETHIDFLSIDTEGSELKILQEIDFSVYNFTVICVENNFLDPAYEAFFKERSYKLHSTFGGCDQIYVKN